jgi:hypothetical protein
MTRSLSRLVLHKFDNLAKSLPVTLYLQRLDLEIAIGEGMDFPN